jgi:hypothetical protein
MATGMAKRATVGAGPPKGRTAREKVAGWLKESGNFSNFQELPNMEFAIQGSWPRPGAGPNSLGIFLVKPETESAIAVIANAGLAPNHKAALQRLDPAKRADFLREIQLGVVFHCGMAFQIDPKTQELVSVQLSREVYYDDLPRREDVYAAMKAVFDGFVYFSLKLEGLPASPYLAP